MKKYLLLMLPLSIFLCGGIFAQTWDDVVQEVKGDTVVVKGYNLSGIINSLSIAVKGDTTPSGDRVSLNRVYETLPGEVYIYDVTCELDATIPDFRIVAKKATGTTMPPLHLRAVKVDGTFDKTFFQTPGNMYASNQYFLHASTTDGTFDREFVRCQGIGARFEYDGCIFELTNWTQSLPQALHLNFFYKNCKFINIGHEGTLEKGCVLETRTVPPDTVWIENCTFLNGGHLVTALENSAPTFVYVNHNTIVNCSQSPLLFSSAAEMIVTNNLFVNTNMAADYPGFYVLIDDDDMLPKGIINSDTVEAAWISSYWPDGYPVAEDERKILLEENSAWWDSRLTEMFNSGMPVIPDSIGQEWLNQMIVMNDRTQAMFNDDDSYPYFVEGTTYNIQPDFANNQDLITEWVSYIITNSTPGAPNGGDFMPWWRTNMLTNVFIPDWPVLANLSYSNATLKSGGINNFPLGDLNWFPSLKSQWEETGEAEVLIEALMDGVIPEDWVVINAVDEMHKVNASHLSVYPNPLTNSTNVEFQLENSTNVSLVLFNTLGETVLIKDLGFRQAGTQNFELSRNQLQSGVYILQLNTEINQVALSERIVIE